MPCRICNNNELLSVVSLGDTPLANNYVPEKEKNRVEETFPLELKWCDRCKLLQLGYVVPPEKMFSHYLYVTSTTKTFRDHFTKMAYDIAEQLKLNESSLVIDIGSNDGLLLKGFKEKNCNVIGVEPAQNLAKLANDQGIFTIPKFWSNAVTDEIEEKHGKADVVTANNVFAHIDDIKEVLRNVKALLKDSGVFVTECAYMFDMFRDMTFDSVYHEHVSYYSFSALHYFFQQEDMQVFDVKHVDTHGGSLRVLVQNVSGPHEVTDNVMQLLEEEKTLGVDKKETYLAFAERMQAVRKTLLEYMVDIKAQGKKIVGYGAPAKATTLLHYCGLNEYIDYIVDDNPLKAGHFMPGSLIPIVGSDELERSRPDYIVILAWNFAKEIIENNQKYKDQGIKFIIPLPTPQVV